MLRWLEEITTDEHRRTRTEPARFYISLLLQRGLILNQEETIELARECVADGNLHRLGTALLMHRVHSHEALGDFIRPHDSRMALWVYSQVDAIDKMIAVLLVLGNYETILMTILSTNYPLGHREIIKQILRGGDLYPTENPNQQPQQLDTPFPTPEAVSLKRLEEAHAFAVCLVREQCGGLDLRETPPPATPPQNPTPVQPPPISQIIDDALQREVMDLFENREEALPQETRVLRINTNMDTFLASLNESQREPIRSFLQSFQQPSPDQLQTMQMIQEELCLTVEEISHFDTGKQDYLASRLSDIGDIPAPAYQTIWNFLPINVHLSFVLRRRMMSMQPLPTRDASLRPWLNFFP